MNIINNFFIIGIVISSLSSYGLYQSMPRSTSSQPRTVTVKIRKQEDIIYKVVFDQNNKVQELRIEYPTTVYFYDADEIDYKRYGLIIEQARNALNKCQ